MTSLGITVRRLDIMKVESLIAFFPLAATTVRHRLDLFKKVLASLSAGEDRLGNLPVEPVMNTGGIEKDGMRCAHNPFSARKP